MDPSLQYIPQLTTHLSSLHVGSAGPYMTAAGHAHHAAYPAALYAANQPAGVMGAGLSLAESDPSASAAASPDEPYPYGALLSFVSI